MEKSQKKSREFEHHKTSDNFSSKRVFFKKKFYCCPLCTLRLIGGGKKVTIEKLEKYLKKQSPLVSS